MLRVQEDTVYLQKGLIRVSCDLTFNLAFRLSVITLFINI